MKHLYHLVERLWILVLVFVRMLNVEKLEIADELGLVTDIRLVEVLVVAHDRTFEMRSELERKDHDFDAFVFRRLVDLHQMTRRRCLISRAIVQFLLNLDVRHVARMNRNNKRHGATIFGELRLVDVFPIFQVVGEVRNVDKEIDSIDHTVVGTGHRASRRNERPNARQILEGRVVVEDDRIRLRDDCVSKRETNTNALDEILPLESDAKRDKLTVNVRIQVHLLMDLFFHVWLTVGSW